MLRWSVISLLFFTLAAQAQFKIRYEVLYPDGGILARNIMPPKIGESAVGSTNFRYGSGYFRVLNATVINATAIPVLNTTEFDNTYFPIFNRLTRINGILQLLPPKIGENSSIGTAVQPYRYGYFSALPVVNTGGFNNAIYPLLNAQYLNGIELLLPMKTAYQTSIGSASYPFREGYFYNLYLNGNISVTDYVDDADSILQAGIDSLDVALGAPEQNDLPVYLAVTHYEFDPSSADNQEDLKLYYSSDGLHFSQLIGDSLFKNPYLSNRTADLSIIFWKDYYWIAYNPRTTYTTNKHFGIARSPNLITWTLVDTIHVTGAVSAWYPNFYLDIEKDSLFLTANVSTGGSRQCWLFKALNASLTSWSSGTVITAKAGGVNDSQLFKVGDLYYLLYVHQGLSATAAIDTAGDVRGPYVPFDTLTFLGSNREGTAVFQLPDNGYRLVIDTMIAPLDWHYVDTYDTFQTYIPSGSYEVLDSVGAFGGIHFLRLNDYRNVRDVYTAFLHGKASKRAALGNFPMAFEDNSLTLQYPNIIFNVPGQTSKKTVELYIEKVGSTWELRVKDSAGNIKTLSDP